MTLRRLSLLLLLILLIIPGAASAVQQTMWNFRGGEVPGEWQISKFEIPQEMEGGLQLVTHEDGKMIRDVRDVPHRVDGVRLTFISTKPVQAHFVWHRRGAPEGELIQLPFSLSGTGESETVHLNVSHFDQWDPYADKLGIGLPAGSEVLLQNIELIRWNIFEKLAAAWSAFWTFDTFRSYSINFLWGPLLVFNPDVTSRLFETLPPVAWSANRFFYLILFLTGIPLLILRFRFRHHAVDGRTFVWIFAAVFAALWIVYDMRMGAEVLSYAWKDYRTYVSQPVGERIFRHYQNFHDIAAQSIPLLQEAGQFGILAPPKTPFVSNMRYLAYPARIVQEQEDTTGVKLWFIFWREDVSVNDAGQLVRSGEILSPPGEVIKRFDEKSFLFRVQ